MSSFLAVVAISLEVLPVLSHRLITSPYHQQEWDSVIVSSDPITIKDKSQNATAPLHPNKPLQPQKRSFECPENDFDCLYATPDNSARLIDRFLQHYSSPPDDTKNLPHTNPPDHPTNSHWTMLDPHTHNHPFDDSTGWVTLDPVPWSTSKISKWHPNKVAIHHDSKPWDYGPTTQRPVQQFWASASSYRPHRPTSHWGVGTNDIITDNRPTGFPTAQFQGHGGLDRAPTQQESAAHPGHQPFDTKANYPVSHNTHPSTYPSNGNGEWVLLSTTKGYSLPQGHRWAPKPPQRLFASRKFTPDISKYHEEDLHDSRHNSPPDNRKSDHPSPSPNTTAPATQPPPHVLYTATPNDAPPTATFRRKLRLQVLPALDSGSTSHGGLLEVDSSPQTVDEAQQEEEKLQKLKAIANVKRGKVRGFKLVPTSKVSGKYDRNVMTLAAVGAGMIPATMALLVPMALGRKRRSFPDVSDGGVGDGRRV